MFKLALAFVFGVVATCIFAMFTVKRLPEHKYQAAVRDIDRSRN